MYVSCVEQNEWQKIYHIQRPSTTTRMHCAGESSIYTIYEWVGCATSAYEMQRNREK